MSAEELARSVVVMYTSSSWSSADLASVVSCVDLVLSCFYLTILIDAHRRDAEAMAAAEELLRELELESRAANGSSQGPGSRKGGGATKKKGKIDMCLDAFLSCFDGLTSGVNPLLHV